jgi:CBS domain-containing protein
MATLVRHVMAADPKTATPSMNAYDAAGLMASYDVGAIPILDEDVLVGLVTDRDLIVRVLASREDPKEVLLGDVATRANLVTVTPDMTLSEARDLMARHRVRRLPVVQDVHLVGMVSLGDLSEADPSARAIGETLAGISESRATTARNEGGPETGTPERVAARRSADRSPGAAGEAKA